MKKARIKTALAAPATALIILLSLAGCAPHRGKLDCHALLAKPKAKQLPLTWLPIWLNGWTFPDWAEACSGGKIIIVKDPQGSEDPYIDVQVILNYNDCTATSTVNLFYEDWWENAKIEVVN